MSFAAARIVVPSFAFVKNNLNSILILKKGSYIHAGTTKMRPTAKPIVFI